MTIGARARMRPVLYPAAIAVAFVLNLMIDSEVSPYAAGRPLILAVGVGLAIPWVAGLASGDRDLAGLIGGVLILLLIASPSPVIATLGLTALLLTALQWLLARRRSESRAAGERMWPLVTRIASAAGLVLLLAVGIKAVQLGRGEAVVHDLVAESPFRRRAVAAATTVAGGLPNMYLVLLDGYPRADKLQSEFGIDASGFIRALGERDFVVATHSRSNHTATRVTLAQMFDYELGIGSVGGDAGQDDLWRYRINEGRFFSDIRGLGYEVVAVSPGFEHVALRQADRFIDTGQPNEFEWGIIKVTALRPLIETALPELAADMSRARVLDAFEVTSELADERTTSPRFILTHIASPHSPQLFEGDGSPLAVRGVELGFDADEIARFGRAEYVRRLGGQLTFVNIRTLDLVDHAIAADPRAVIVVFSDHGSGVRSDSGDRLNADADLRTANLLAVRSPGRTGIIDDRSTLANLLPRLLRAYAGIGPPDMPETIYISAEDPSVATVFVRPD